LKQIITQEALTRLLVEKGIFIKEGFREMVRAVGRKVKKKVRGAYIFPFPKDKNTERRSYEKRSTKRSS